MNSLFETFQKVVESGREDPAEGIELTTSGQLGQGTASALSLDQFPDDVPTLKRMLLAKHRDYAVLYEESEAIQAKLDKTTRHLVLQRDLWLASLESQESTIQSLVTAAVRLSQLSPAPTDTVGAAQPSPVEDGGVYLEALLDQIDMLKTSLTTVTSEKEALQLALDQELRQQSRGVRHPTHGYRNGTSSVETELSEEHQNTLRKLHRMWEEERTTYEEKIRRLTATIHTNEEAMTLLAEKYEGSAGKPPSQDVFEGAIAVDGGVVLPPPALEEIPAPQPPATPPVAKSSSSPPVSSADVPSSMQDEEPRELNSIPSHVSLQQDVQHLQRALEQSQQECRAREDALSAMYDDNRRLEEENHHLREELAIYKEESERGTASSNAGQQRLIEEQHKTRTLTAALEAAQQELDRTRRELAVLQETARRTPSATPPAAATKTGSMIPATAAQPDITAPKATGGPAAPGRARDFVRAASAKLSAAKERSGTGGMHKYLRFLLGLALALTVMIFFSLAFGSNGPSTAYDERTVEELLRAQLRTCLDTLKAQGVKV